MEVACSSASPGTPHRQCCSLHDSDDVSDDVTDDVDTGPRSSPVAEAAPSCHGDTTPSSSPTSPVDDAKNRLYPVQRHHHHHHHHHHQSRHHGDMLSPRHTVNKLQQSPPPRTCCSLDIASIVANDNRMTFLDNR